MLAFFLWLTLSIVSNGTAYSNFLGEHNLDVQATEFLGTSNMVNYIIAISLLLMGIKTAAASGAAGANFAAKGMDIRATVSAAGGSTSIDVVTFEGGVR